MQGRMDKDEIKNTMPQEESSSIVGIVAILAIVVIGGGIAFFAYRKAQPVAPQLIEVTLPYPAGQQKP